MFMMKLEDLIPTSCHRFAANCSLMTVVPVRSSAGAAGYDLSAAHESSVPAHGKALIKTDVAMAIPDGYYGRIAPRSSLAWKNHIDVGAGVIDSDYRGNIGVVLFNHSSTELKVAKGMRIAQLIITKIETTRGIQSHPPPNIFMLWESTDPERQVQTCLLYTSPSPRDKRQSRMPSSA